MSLVKLTNEEMLNLPLGENDALEPNNTIKDYLKELLMRLWSETEGFSGKRPFGNSGWEYELYKPLVVAGVIAGTVDEDGIDNVDTDAGDQIIFSLISEL